MKVKFLFPFFVAGLLLLQGCATGESAVADLLRQIELAPCEIGSAKVSGNVSIGLIPGFRSELFVDVEETHTEESVRNDPRCVAG